MFDRVLVGVDGGQGGEDAIALAGQLGGSGAKLTLAHVCADHPLAPASDADRAAAEAMLVERRAQLGGDAELAVVRSASPAKGLHELAEGERADLIVLGSCHRGALGRATLGSDTREGLDGAPCAVAVAPWGYAASAKRFATIGVGYDGSPESELALAAARAIAARTTARIRALKVVSAGPYVYTGLMPPAGEGIGEILQRAQAEVSALDGVDGEVEYGSAGEELAAFSRHVDLLVAGSRAYGPARRLVGGGACRHLLAHCRAPLLVLPRGDRRGPAPGSSTA